MDFKRFAAVFLLTVLSSFVTSQQLAPNELCEGVKINSFVPDPEDCSKFYQCNGDTTIHGTCPTGMFYHAKDVCSFDQSDCNSFTTPISTTTIPDDNSMKNESASSTISSTITTPSIDSAIDPESYCLSSNPNIPSFVKSLDNCSNYYICVDQAPVLQKCATGKYWNPIHQYCDDPEAVICEHDRIADPEEICQQRPLSGISFTASPNNCGEYYICIKQKPFRMNCAPGTHWNSNSNQCDEADIANCKISTPSTIDLDELCAQRKDVFLSHPRYCDLYLFCRNGKSSTQRCPFLTDWDSVNKRCTPRHQTICTKQRFHSSK
uniref:Chitin-binding type-2 domain-containing protein n=1 Tax=Anopheles merus TaxID=30066 RepID=A0A9I3MIH2_ANOME